MKPAEVSETTTQLNQLYRTVRRGQATSAHEHADELVLGVLVFLVCLTVGLFMVLHDGIIQGDAFSRVINAYYVFLRPHPHFAAIGFIWNPLPSLLELPFTLLKNLWPPLVTMGLAANLVSAGFAGLGAALLYRILVLLGIARGYRLLWSAIYALNPMILLYGANGMTDLMLVATFLGLAEGLIAYHNTSEQDGLMRAGLWLAVGFLLRYEALAVGALVAIGFIFTLLRTGRQQEYVEAMVLVLELPLVYVAGIWMFVNWLIMKNPLYFLLSPYGNASQLQTGSYQGSQLAFAYHHVGHTLAILGGWSLIFLPIVPSFLWVAVSQLRRRADPRGLSLLAATLGVPCLQGLLLYLGKSADWSRFFIYNIPFGFVLTALSVQLLPVRWRKTMLIVVSLLLLIGDGSTWRALHSPVWGRGSITSVEAVQHGRTTHPFAEQFSVAAYINQHPHIKVLLDTFTSYAVVVGVKNPNQFIMTADLDFQSVLQNPGGRVNMLLVPKPVGVGALNALNRAYPGLWAGRLSWTSRVIEFPGPSHYRLYRVLPTAP